MSFTSFICGVAVTIVAEMILFCGIVYAAWKHDKKE